MAIVPIKIVSKPADEDFDLDLDGIDFFSREPETMVGQILKVSYSHDNPKKEHQIILDVRTPAINAHDTKPFVCPLNEASDFTNGINSKFVFIAEDIATITDDEGNDVRTRYVSRITLDHYFNPDTVPDADLRQVILSVIPKPIAMHYGIILK